MCSYLFLFRTKYASNKRILKMHLGFFLGRPKKFGSQYMQRMNMYILKNKW